MASNKAEWKAPLTIEELFEKTAGNAFAQINSSTAGPRKEKEVDVGEADYQLYSMATPNGQKIGILLEELGVKYDAHRINIMAGDQFDSGFVAINPNSKIPALVDQTDKEHPISIFESGSILLHLADKEKKFIPQEFGAARTEVINWLMWQMGTGPYFGQFGHFYRYAPRDKIEAIDYGVARYGMETQRCLSVLDQQLAKNDFICSWGYSIADMAIYPWVRCVSNDGYYKAGTFLGLDKYKNIARWMHEMESREAVVKGMQATSA